MSEEEIRDRIEKLWAYKWKRSPLCESPLLVLAPEEGSDALRVYSCGGRLYDIPTTVGKGNKSHIDMNYRNYCDPKWTDGQGKDNIIPDGFKHDQSVIDMVFSKDADWDKIDNRDELLDYLVLATINNNLKKNRSKKEKWIQNDFLKEQIRKTTEETDLLFFDMEFKIPFPEGRKRIQKNGDPVWNTDGQQKESKSSEVDLVAFDGKSFGLIELKYNGESMEEDKDNSLREHYLDFQYFMTGQKNAQIRKKARIELLRRLWYLFRYTIIDASWKESFERIGIRKSFWEEEHVFSDESLFETPDLQKYRNIKFWAGFFFENDESAPDNRTEQYFVKQMNNQVREEFNKNKSMDLRYFYRGKKMIFQKVGTALGWK